MKEAIQSVVGQFLTYGTRHITHQLRRLLLRYAVGRKWIQRLMRSINPLRPVKRVKISTNKSEHGFPRFPNLMKDLVVSFPYQVWMAYITCIRLKNNFVYLVVSMDVFTLSILGWHLSRSQDQNLTLNALLPALVHRCPEIHHSN